MRTTFGMLHAFAISSFANETRDGRAILAELLAQHLHRNGAVSGVLGLENRRSAAFADFALQGVAGDDLADEVLARHAANLMVALRAWQATRRGN